MGPSFFNDGNLLRIGSHNSALSRFNGAVVFQRRKLFKTTLKFMGRPSFNGAVVFQRRKLCVGV